jgi:hypothetical protein
MDLAYISALAALGGSVVGGLTSGFTTWQSQLAQAKAAQLAHDKSQREGLYKDFIVAATRAYGDAIVCNEPQIQELLALYAMISRMRVLSAPRTVEYADGLQRGRARGPAGETVMELDDVDIVGAHGVPAVLDALEVIVI